MACSLNLITEEEGFRSTMYHCTEGKCTIGYGFNLESGMSEEEAKAILLIRLDKIAKQMEQTYEWYAGLSVGRKAVIDSMVYQLGFAGFGKFKNTIKAIGKGHWQTAAKEMKDSLAYRQTTARWDRQLSIFRKG